MIDATPYKVMPIGLAEPISWAEIFGNDRPVELEIGSGKGLFLANAATARPDCNFFGIEKAVKYARRAADRVAKRALVNVRVCPGDAKSFMSKNCPAKSLHAIHVYFPDPWWKAKHKKRRMFAEPLMVDMERTLIAGADLYVATDVEEYFGVIKELVASHPRFVELPTPTVHEPVHELDYLTSFERKYRIEGRPIYRAHYKFD
jgi:tRNA (guanine-N7-)-methyltransferase